MRNYIINNTNTKDIPTIIFSILTITIDILLRYEIFICIIIHILYIIFLKFLIYIIV